MNKKSKKIEPIVKQYGLIKYLLLIAIIVFVILTLCTSKETSFLASTILILPGIFSFIESVYAIKAKIHDSTYSMRVIYWFLLLVSYIPIFILVNGFIWMDWPTGYVLLSVITVIGFLGLFSIIAGWSIPIVIVYICQSLKYRKSTPINKNTIFENIAVYRDESNEEGSLFKKYIFDRFIFLILKNYRVIFSISHP